MEVLFQILLCDISIKCYYNLIHKLLRQFHNLLAAFGDLNRLLFTKTEKLKSANAFTNIQTENQHTSMVKDVSLKVSDDSKNFISTQRERTTYLGKLSCMLIPFK